MIEHLRSVLSKRIFIRVDLPDAEDYVLKPCSIIKIFKINNFGQFSRCAELAVAYFKAYPEKKKLSRKDWDQVFPAEAMTPCSFLNTEAGIFAQSRSSIVKKKHVKIKLALKVSSNEDSTLYTVKIQKFLSTDGHLKAGMKAIQIEARIGRNQGYFVASLLHRAQDYKWRERFYLIAPYKGVNLRQWLEKLGPSNLQRLEAAIAVAWLIHQSHQGAEEREGIVLRDIKLDNFLIDEEAPQGTEITRIDYGFSIEHINLGTAEDVHGFCGTPTTLPYTLPLNKKSIQSQESEVQALLTIWGAKSFDTFAFKCICLRGELTALLLSQEKNLPKSLFERIDTSQPAAALERMDTVLEIGACLVLYLYNLEVPKERLSLVQQETIMSLHFDCQYSEKEIRLQLMELMARSVLQEEAEQEGFSLYSFFKLSMSQSSSEAAHVLSM